MNKRQLGRSGLSYGYGLAADTKDAVALIRAAFERGVAPAQLALPWLLKKQPWIVPMPGTNQLHRLKENVGAAAVALADADLLEIEAAVAAVPVQRARYSADRQTLVGRRTVAESRALSL